MTTLNHSFHRTTEEQGKLGTAEQELSPVWAVIALGAASCFRRTGFTPHACAAVVEAQPTSLFSSASQGLATAGTLTALTSCAFVQWRASGTGGEEADPGFGVYKVFINTFTVYVCLRLFTFV